jgi:hypothetical protein
VNAYGFLDAEAISYGDATGYLLIHDIDLVATIYVDANLGTPGDGIFPTWQPTFSWLPGYADSNTKDYVTGFMVSYEITRVA